MLVANWKSNFTLTQAQAWIEKFLQLQPQTPYLGVICPPFPLLSLLATKLGKKNLGIALGVQDISQFPAGAYTGAVSALNLQDFSVKYAILGHSERRKYFHETVLDVANKVQSCLEAEITPIVCVDASIIRAQAEAMEPDQRKNCMVAFEDPAHIGTGVTSSPKELEAALLEIHMMFGVNTPILYGGSVDEYSGKEFLIHPKLSGLLIGSAGLDPQKFANLLAIKT